ncbi:hypothetical protein JRQ81_012489 [Phrynocephalus forsythii]|uniref:Rho family-interacting cell polarization regulator 2 n=1 Tax=Phrynocephalus forsythii TaxID=171643 RepID=A0A9Q1B5V5_9SAUR|nr:hypothetical protein JRQ81_012489 [Phrynocephalus forsythii]
MSVGSHSFSPGGPNGIIRSQSFAGFSGLQERRSRCNSFIENSSALKKPQAKVKKMHNLGSKSNSTSKEPRPERMEEVYKALKNGLDEYLEVHQTELEKLTAQLKDMKRNSRLGVLYDLDKQMKAIERYMRKLEFRISKVDELFEAYCIQRRLRDGASKMKQAFGLSPASKAARESLSEINKSYKEYTENMCTIESELENLMGEFCIKMKGLAGFARLCPGDQYEIFMRYGRQRWKLKGKIEVNCKQSWDGEEMIFVPLVVGLISIKVTELKGLASHILVGSVTCETKDLFAAQPQVVAVDINDLGTIKLNLEITWHPFDVEDVTPSSGNTNKASALQRRMSMYSQGTPETPTFKDHSFFSNLADDVFENGTTENEKRPLSFSFSGIPNGEGTFSSSSVGSSSTTDNSNPEITVTPPEHNGQTLPKTHTVDNISTSSSVDSVPESKDLNSQERVSDNAESKTSTRESEVCQTSPHLRSDNHLFLDNRAPVSLLQDPEELSELKPVELDTFEGNITKQLVKRLTSGEGPLTPEKLHCEGSISGESEGYKSCVEGSLEEAFQGLILALEPHKDQFKEFQVLDQEVTHLDEILKCRTTANHSRSSSLSLTVESALESFDFLNTSDFEDDGVTDELCSGGRGGDSVFSDTEVEKHSYRSEHPEVRGHLSEALTEDTGVGTSVAGSPLPLTTGNESLDITVVKHLQYCTQLIQQIVFSNKTPFVTRYLLDKLSQQILVIKSLAEISSENMGGIRPANEAIPEFQKRTSLLSFWNKCTSSPGMYHTSAEKMIKQLDVTFATAVNNECAGLSETVFKSLVSHIVDRTEPVLSSSPSLEVITVFQYYNYFASKNVNDLTNYLLQFAREALMVQTLQSLRDEKFLQNKTALTSLSLLPQQEVLKSLALLLLSENTREIHEAVVAVLSAAASENKHFREKALVYYCETLAQPNLHLQKAACLALKCLQATESIKMLATLCQSDNEEIRKVASETLLSLGEDGRLAYEQLDKFPREFTKVGGRRATEVATAF